MTDLKSLARAARPGLFDTIHDPELMTVLILANLMSPELWTIAENIKHRVDGRDLNQSEKREHALIAEALSFVDHHFTHLLLPDVAELTGVIDIEGERSWNGSKLVDTVLSEIHEEVDQRIQMGSLEAGTNPEVFIQKGQFPNYSYMSFEGLHAQRLMLRNVRRKPKGVSVCADEATLIAALLSALGVLSFQNFVIFGAPAHYTVLTFGADDICFWANGKREFFDADSWKALIAGSESHDPQEEFDKRQSTAERVITPYGVALLREGESTLTVHDLRRISSASEKFFGTKLRQLDPIDHPGFALQESAINKDQFADFHKITGSDDAYLKITQATDGTPGSVFERAFYCLRDISVAHPEAYLLAALRGPLVRNAARDIKTFENACDVVAAVKGCQSSRENPDHLCLPDETLLFQTGDHRDKAFLLFTLLVASPALNEQARRRARLEFTDAGAFVFWDKNFFDLHKWTFGEISGQSVMSIRTGSIDGASSILLS